MGIEDAAALGVVLADAAPEDDLPTLLRVYQDIRKPRASAIQLSSSDSDLAGLTDVAARIREVYHDSFPKPGTPKWTRPWRDWIHPYDVVTEATTTLQEFRRRS